MLWTVPIVKTSSDVAALPSWKIQAQLDFWMGEKVGKKKWSVALRPSGRSIAFSPDGKRFAYVAMVGEKKWSVVLDGDERKWDDDELEDLPFSTDNERLVYGARMDGQSFVVVDGKEQKPYRRLLEGTIRFSPGSQFSGCSSGVMVRIHIAASII